MWGLLSRGFKAVAAGGAQRSLGIQSPHLPSAVTRIGRFLYITSGAWIGVSWYVGYANARTQTGGGPSLVLPGAPVVNTVDRTTHTPGFVGKSTANVPGSQQTGARGGGVRMQVARLALSLVNAHGFTWAEVRPMPHSIRTRPFRGDCSTFVTKLYQAVGAADPNGLDYNGSGNTDTLQKHGTLVSKPNIGDLAFWSNPDHVAIVVSTGNDPLTVGFGSSPAPIKNTVSNESQFHERFVGFRSYL
jgi:hypothetical protein